jgi:hypothetical protein
MERANVFAVVATGILLVMTLMMASAASAASNATGNDTTEGCASGCSTDTAVGIVNVTLVEGPPAVTGFFIQPFDFSGFFSAISSMLSAAFSFLGH